MYDRCRSVDGWRRMADGRDASACARQGRETPVAASSTCTVSVALPRLQQD